MSEKKNEPCPTCGTVKASIKLRVGKYAGIITAITLIVQTLCTLDITTIP